MVKGCVPCYIPILDKVEINPLSKTEDGYFSTLFHELAHSTGSKKRLNRDGVVKGGLPKTKSDYAVEECIAEITAHLCCSECNIQSFKTSGTAEYDNNIAYVQHWKQRIEDWGKEFMYIVSQADKAFSYIMDKEDL